MPHLPPDMASFSPWEPGGMGLADRNPAPGAAPVASTITDPIPAMKTPLILATVIAAFALTACDSSQEEARKKALEAQADQIEKQADATRKLGEAAAETRQKQMEANAEATKAGAKSTAEGIKKNAENQADALEDKADQVRDAK